MDMALAPAHRGRSVRLLVAAALVCLVQLVVAQFLSSTVAAGHAQFHAFIALVAVAVALGIAWRWPASGLAGLAPVVGFSAFAVAQFVESLGAFGYGPDNDGRINGMAGLHDLGLGLTALGLVAAVAGLSVGVAAAGIRRQGSARIGMIAGAIVVGLGGLVVVKTMIGF